MFNNSIYLTSSELEMRKTFSLNLILKIKNKKNIFAYNSIKPYHFKIVYNLIKFN